MVGVSLLHTIVAGDPVAFLVDIFGVGGQRSDFLVLNEKVTESVFVPH
jgi:hypothetical protein